MGENSTVETTYRLQIDTMHQALPVSIIAALHSSLLFQSWACHIPLPVPFTHHVQDFLPHQVFGSQEEKQPVMPKIVVVF